MTLEMKLNEERAKGRAEGQGYIISLLLSSGNTYEEVARMFKMSVTEVQKLENIYLEVAD